MRPTPALSVAVAAFVALVAGCPDADAKPGAALARPTPSPEPAAAHVLDVTGALRVRPAAGAPFAAAAGLDLVESDTLEPDTGGAAILQLENGHLVRVDDAGPLAVRDLLLLRAPPTTRSVDDQLRAFVDATPEAQRTIRERAAAWRQMRRAADTSRGVERGRSAAPAPASPLDQLRAAESASGPQAGAAPSPPPPPPEPEQKAAKGKETTQRDEAPLRAKSGAESGALGGLALRDRDGDDGAAPAPTFSAKRGPTPQTATPWTVPAALRPTLVDVQTCVANDVRALGLAVPSVELRVHVVQNRVTRVGLSGGLPPPACVRALLGAAMALPEDGVLVVLLPLP